MNRVGLIVTIIIGVFLVIIGVSMNDNLEYNVYYNKYDKIGYEEIELSDIQLKRYNEKINSNKISYLVGNLNVLLEDNYITDLGIVKYSVLFAREYDYRYENNVKQIKNIEYIKKSYLEKIIKEVFNIRIDINKLRIDSKDGYIMTGNIESIITDAYYLSLDKILYNSDEDIYIAEIYMSRDDYEDEESKNKEIADNILYGISVRYKKNENKPNTILEYNIIEVGK